MTGVIASITRGDLKLAYHYDPAGRLYQVDQLDGQVVMAKTVRHYDEASRVLWIEHRGAANLLLLRIDYEWNLDNTIAERTESDYTVSPATTTVVTFEYDACQRLVYEAREVQGTPGTPVYAFEYYYDPLGNRTQKLDLLNEITTNYVYDTDYSDPENQLDYPTRNNRLLSYSVYGPGPSGSVLLRTVTYSYYRATGNVSNITVKDECEGCDEYRDLKLVYTSNGKLWLAVWGTWELGQQDYAVTDIWEFRYASGRQRYWARQWVAQNGSPNPGNWVPAEGAQWTDYAGEEPRLDSSLALDDGTPIAAPTARYLAGAGLHTRETVSSGAIQRLHGDAVGSTVLTTDADGQTSQKAAYTAFGEYVSPTGAVGGELPAGYPRYGFAGAHGYESGLLTLAGANPNLPPITLQHVGERWYDPGLGRFIQRDPIGLAGGLNVYLYCGANPLTNVDPDGLWSLWRWAYTGDGNAEDEVYGAAVNAAGQWLYESSWLRGVYVGVGTKRNRGVNVSAGVSWTIDSGFNVYVCVSAGWSERVRGLRNGRFSSRTSGIGYVGSWGEGGWGGGFILGGGQNQKARGGFAGAGGDGTISIGGSRGVLQGGFILDPGRIVR